ncbi:MAG: GvpL/GvpF family gas vesicle protein [Chloroflexi bacterium]|nr:GvpL/GvpF family gas vesicle protein [Chloroflexota bacterium]
MPRKYLYGIIPTSQPMSFGPSGFPQQSEAVYSVVHKGLGCVVSDYSGEDFASLPRETLLRCLMAHQEVIERVMKERPVLPVKFGTLVDGDADVHKLIDQNGKRLSDALEQLGETVQMEVAATWDLPFVLAEIGKEEELVRLRGSLTGRPAAAVLEQRIHAGMRVKEALDRRREEYRQRLLESLRAVALDVQPNPLVADEMAINVAFLIDREREARFDEAVRELDRAFHERLRFRVIGPLPPYSFATVEVVRPCAEKLNEARRRLGLGASVSREEVKQAFRRLAAQTHPDARGENGQGDEEFVRVREAYELLSAYCRGQTDGERGTTEEPRCSLAPEDVSQALLINLRRATGEAA